MLIVVGIIGGLIMVPVMAKKAEQAAGCFIGGYRYHVETHWDPWNGCTVDFLGLQIPVG